MFAQRPLVVLCRIYDAPDQADTKNVLPRPVNDQPASQNTVVDFTIANPADLPEPQRRQIQIALKAGGFYSGKIDGDFGPESQAAWRHAKAASLTGLLLRTTILDDAKRAEYTRLWNLAVILPEHRDEVSAEVRRLLAGRDRYEAVAAATGVPWWIIGLIHGRECDYSFHEHLHNGDPLSARTVHVPAGRPLTGRPPFSWEYSAADALAFNKFTGWTDWSIPGALHKLEGYNGFGPRLYHGRATGYLWAATNVYAGGKYVADGVWDGTVEDQQPGCAAILKALVECGAVKLMV